MSILYQALSRAARENARRNGTEAATAEADEPAAGAGARLRTFTSLSFRPGRAKKLGNRRGLILLSSTAAALTGLFLLLSSLPSDMVADIPVVSDVTALLGMAPEPFPFSAGNEATNGDAGQTLIVAGDDRTIISDEESMLTPPPALADAVPEPGSGIEFEIAFPPAEMVAAATALTDDVTDTAVEETGVEDMGATTQEPDALAPETQTANLGDDIAPAALLPESTADSLHPTDAPPAEARETLEQTLQRLANERGFTDLAPPVEISRAGEADAQAAETTQNNADFSITVDARSSVQQASFEAAYSSLLAGNTEGALNLYMDVLKDDPDNTFALFGLASTLQRIGWLAEARATYEELLAVEPDNRGALANMMTLISQEAPDQALSNLQRLFEINPGFSPIPAQMAVLYAGQGDYDQAIRFLKLASDLSPENMMYVYNLAIIHDRLGDHVEARKLYEEVLSASEIRDVSIPLEAVRQRVSYLKKL